MQSIFRAVYSWIKQPDFKDRDKNLLAFYIQVIALIIILAGLVVAISDSVSGRFDYVIQLTVLILCLILVVALVRFGKLKLASNALLVALLGLETLYILLAGGIHASVSMLYPVLLIVASLILERKAFIFYVFLCSASVGMIIFAEHQKLILPYYPDPPEFPLFVSYLFMILGSAILIRYLSETLQTSLRTSRRHEEQLAAQKSMLDQVGQAVVGADAQNRIVYWNAAAADLYGYAAKEVIGKDYDEVIHLDITPEVARIIRETLRQNQVWTGEFIAHRRDGQAVPLIGNIAPLPDARNKVAGWVAVVTDITEREKATQVANRRTQELSLLNQLGISLASGKNLYDTLLALQRQISKLLQVDAFYVAIYDEVTDVVSFPIFFVSGKPETTPPRHLREKPGLTGAIIFDGNTLYLPEVGMPDVMNAYRPLDDDYPELHTFLGIPLKVNDRTIGVMSTQSQAVNAYTPEQIQLMENIAVQAAISIDKARLMDQIQDELHQRKDLIEDLAAIHAVSQAAASQLELDALFDLVAQELFELFDIQEIYFGLYDPSTELIQFPYYRHGNQRLSTDPIPISEGLSSRVILSRQPLLINSDYEKRSAELGVVRFFAVPGSISKVSWLGVPIQAGEQVIGVICVQNLERENAFTESDVRLLTTIAANVGIAIQNARLYSSAQVELVERKKLIEELEARNAESETLRETTAIVISTLDVSDAVQRILEQLKRVVPYDSSSVWLYRTDKAVMVGFNGLTPEALLPGEYPLDGSQPDSPLRNNKAPYILLKDIQQQYEQFRKPPLNYVHAWMAIPLWAHDKLIGFISLDARKPGQFDEHDALLAVTYANQVAIALENARLFTELQSQLLERRKLINDLENKNTELERFTYTVSHDLKAPLITIRGFLGFLERDALDQNVGRLRTDIQRITAATEKMQLLLKDLLELSRIGRLMNESVNIPFDQLMRDALDAVQGRLFESRIPVYVQPNLPAVFGDKPRLVEVFQNLLDNAAKFMGDQPHPNIEVGQAGEENGKPIFFVRDNGIGIASNQHERIFGLFNKLDANSEGTGVGLSIVKRIIEVHGGRIWVESGAGAGSTFYFTLPRGN